MARIEKKVRMCLLLGQQNLSLVDRFLKHLITEDQFFEGLEVTSTASTTSTLPPAAVAIAACGCCKCGVGHEEGLLGAVVDGKGGSERTHRWRVGYRRRR